MEIYLAWVTFELFTCRCLFISFFQVLNACVKRKNLEGAFWVLQELKKQGLQPSTSTYGLVMEVGGPFISFYCSCNLQVYFEIQNDFCNGHCLRCCE